MVGDIDPDEALGGIVCGQAYNLITVDMRAGMCADMRAYMCVDMCADMCVDICVDIRYPPLSALYRRRALTGWNIVMALCSPYIVMALYSYGPM